MSRPTGQPKQTVRQLRQARGWRQVDLAARLSLRPEAVATWERGQKMPNEVHQQALADLFGVSVAAIAFGPAAQP